MDVEQYFDRKTREMAEEYGSMIQSQRDEIEQLQRRCNELLHERNLMRAAVAEDVRQFCLRYVEKQQAQQLNRLVVSTPVHSIPVLTLLHFLHEYSAGLVPIIEVGRRKRSRDTTSGTWSGPSGPHQQRLVQRMVARQCLRRREADAEELPSGVELQMQEL
uniref:Uncharacterized protein n=1 Tax=Trypanosoma congolense (strain IL3000) TaxID=1068625 RepID=G0UVK3_TRYCI|nr:conserved hypothetical protein [Trypanosoma congolense IL3000]